MDALAGAHDAAVQMIDTFIVRVHQHGACITRNRRQSMGGSRGGLTSKIHALVDSNGLPVRLALSAGEAHDNRLAGKLLSRLKSTGRALLEGRVIHIADVLADPDYTWAEAQRLGGYRTVLAVPMMREDVPMGVLTLIRSEVRPFSEKQIELVSTFADQAAIAIENVRLFDEIQDKNRQLAEASEHSRSSSPA